MIPRSLTRPAINAFEQYPVVTLVGPRQSGKTTLARNAFDLPYINLEAPDERDFVLSDPRGFLASHPDGAIIGEIQRAPDLTSYLQVRVDETNRLGQFLLTGSHNFAVREQLSRSLAGRTALLTLLPFSRPELVDAGVPCGGYFNYIFAGGYPRIRDAGLDPTSFHRDYVGTYLERDLRQLSAVRNIAQFQTFMRLCAANIGQVLNLNRLASDCGISQTTATEWLNLMESGYILYRLQPYFTNTRKRLVRRPKLYFHDTGVACFLLGLTAAEHVENHPLRGALFENHVINEVLKHDLNRNRTAQLQFFRDSNGNEVDLLYGRGPNLVPIEIKSGQTISSDWFKGIDHFARHFPATGGAVIYAGEASQHRSDGRAVLPADELAAYLEAAI
ncbi:MAG: ATP-binding protein [Gammaproteobacteria bacterium]|nr:ATP-binding protein [Gammaproteobacteria bacterium]MDE0270534.1 ATP-binding protein [Gammaproteobacteria bacterium]